MTEYDFSEEAYEKYLATQARIARWVDHTQRSKLVTPDFPPTPLEHDTNVPLPRERSRKSRSSALSKSSTFDPVTAPPERTKRPASRKRSMSMSAHRPPTPFRPTPELPESSHPEDILSPAIQPSPEQTMCPAATKRTPHSARATHPWPEGFIPTKHVPEPGCPVYYPDYDSDPPSQPMGRKRSISFSAPVTRPILNDSPPAPQLYNSFYSEPAPREQSSYYSSHNSSPNYPSAYATANVPPSSALAPTSSYPVQGFSYPFPHQQYPDYGAARQPRPTRSKTAPAHHSPHYSIDSSPYSYSTGHSYQSAQTSAYPYQHYPQPPPQSKVKPQPAMVPVTFPNGTIAYAPAPKPGRIDPSRVRLRFIRAHYQCEYCTNYDLP